MAATDVCVITGTDTACGVCELRDVLELIGVDRTVIVCEVDGSLGRVVDSDGAAEPWDIE